MSLFRKRVAKNLRQKRNDSDDETAQHSNEESTSQKNTDSSRGSTPVSVKSGDNSRNSATVSNKGNVLLSFGDEENNEEETFQVKKSNQSRKFEKMRQRMLAENERKKDNSSNNGNTEIDQKSRNFLNADSRQQQKKKADAVNILTGRDAEAIELAEEDEAGEFRKALTRGEIPDANLIHKARKQRQQARETQEFVPLDDTQKYHKEKSRLVREDDNEASDSGEEGGQFYSRLRNDNENERRQFESEFLSVEQGSDNDNDDEFDRWELEQIRKGVSLQQISSYQHEQLSASGYYVQSAAMYPGTAMNQHQFYAGVGAKQAINLDSSPVATVEIKDPQPMDLDIELPHDDDGDVHHATGNFKGCAPLPKVGGGDVETGKNSLNILSLRSKIKERLEESQNLCRAFALDEEKLVQQSSENAELIEKLQENAPKLSTQFEFYQEIRSYVRDLLDCFDEKMPTVERLEQRAMNLYQNRTNFIIRRRQQDVRDQFDECSSAAFAKTQIGQDPDRMMRAAEREARKTRRRQAREKSLAGLGHHDGLSSDDEEAPSRLANFASEKEAISNDAANVFSDTIDDFCDVKSIVERFFHWRKQDFDAYDQAFVDLCMPKLLSPLIRFQMIAWNPTDADFVNLTNFNWFQSLRTTVADYNSQFSVDFSKRNDVGFLIPSVIEKVVCPKLTDFVQKIWDPTSTCQSERLASFVRNLVKEYFPDLTTAEFKNLQIFTDAVVKRIKLSLDEDLFTPIYTKEMLENKSLGASVYSDRQFWFALKFMKNILNWDNILPTKIVQDLMLDGVLNRHLVLSLQCSVAVDSATLLKCKSICNVFPAAWLKKNEPLIQFEPLFKVLCRIADEIYQLKSSDKTDGEKIKEICRLLVKLGDSNYSSKFAEKYRLR